MTDQELENHIKDCARLMEKAAVDTSWQKQYLRDLKTLDRIEFQNECFFDAMGAIQSEGRQE